MKRKIAGIRIHSVRFKLIAAVFAILFPLWVYFLYNNLYAIRVVREQVANSNKNLVSLYMQNIDYRLNSVEKYLASTLSYNINLNNMEYGADEGTRESAETLAFRQITNDIAEYDFISSIFVYSGDYKKYFAVYSMDTVTYNDKQIVDSYIRNLINSDANSNTNITAGYFTTEINGKYYIFRMLRQGNLYIGAWVSADYLLVPLKLINFGENGASLFVSSNGKPMNNMDFIINNGILLGGNYHSYYMTGKNDNYLIVGEKSDSGAFSLVAAVPDRAILENLIHFQQTAIVTAAVFILIILAYILFIRRSFDAPMAQLLKVMKRIQSGDIDQRIAFKGQSDEFTAINDTFNRMMDQIKDLKISVYEERLAKQQEELEHLQLQISPHFFMNSLNIIYSLAQLKKFKLVQEMSLCLFRYFGYISRKNMKLVRLEEEIQHIRNYIRIQELRFPNGFTYAIQAQESLMGVLVPPLVIQTFVENIMKYALTMDDPVQISIVVLPVETGMIKISICNSGSRIDDGILEQLRAGKRIVDEQGEHIGIWNIQRRLELIYSGKAGISLRNTDPDGVEIEIIIPMEI